MLRPALQRVVYRQKWKSTYLLGSNLHRYMSDVKDNFYDITISGGGLIGGAMACSIASSTQLANKKVLLLESQAAPANTDLKAIDPSQPYSSRVCAISPGSRTLFEKLGAWDHIGRKSIVKKMQIWDASSDALLTLDKNEMTEDLAYIIENNLMTSVLTGLLHEESNKNVEVRYGTKIKSCILPKNYARKEVNDPLPNVTVQLENGQEIETSLLIAADGANSSIAEGENISKVSWEYNQSAVVATLKLSEPFENIVAWQRFLPQGPIAMLPLDDNHSSLVWSTSHDHAEGLLEMDVEEFISEVNDAFWKEYPKHETTQRAEGLFQSFMNSVFKEKETSSTMQFPPTVAELQGSRAKFPLSMKHSNNYVKPRLVLIGDAAHKVHPLAGQGANLGFGDVTSLIRVLEQAVYEGKDIGCLSHLLTYEQERQLRSASVMTVIESLHRLYSTTSPPLVALRSIGLMFTNRNASLKEKIINQAINVN